MGSAADVLILCLILQMFSSLSCSTSMNIGVLSVNQSFFGSEMKEFEGRCPEWNLYAHVMVSLSHVLVSYINFQYIMQ